MPLLTYSQARPWAKAIREAVTLHKMPPWFADPQYGAWENDPSLTADDVARIQAWADAGAPEGSAKDAPPRKKWPDGWSGPSPDIVLSAPKFPVPAKAVIEYQYVILPLGFSLDRWARSVEIRPVNRTVIHHAVLFVREPGSDWLREAPKEVMFAPKPGDDRKKARQTTADILAIYTPGAAVTTMLPRMAKKIPAGSDLVLQIHYTSTGVNVTDQTDVGLSLSTERPKYRVLTLQMGNEGLDIPPGDRNFRVSVSGAMPRDAMLLSLFPHMHLRGSSFEYQIVYPGGRVETLLKVKPYDFHWQLSYRLKTPRLLKRGDRLLWTGYFDNSAANPRNPDPTAEVTWGEQSWEEMMIGFFDVAVDPDVDKIGFFGR